MQKIEKFHEQIFQRNWKKLISSHSASIIFQKIRLHQMTSKLHAKIYKVYMISSRETLWTSGKINKRGPINIKYLLFITLHKKWTFPLRPKSAGICGFCHILKKSSIENFIFFCSVKAEKLSSGKHFPWTLSPRRATKFSLFCSREFPLHLLLHLFFFSLSNGWQYPLQYHTCPYFQIFHITFFYLMPNMM